MEREAIISPGKSKFEFAISSICGFLNMSRHKLRLLNKIGLIISELLTNCLASEARH